MSLRVGIDVDGVLADFKAAFHETSRTCLGRRVETLLDPKSTQALGQGDVKKVWEVVARTPNWWMTLKPYEPEQIARVYSLTRAAGWEVFFLTNRPESAGDSVQFQTQSWIESHGFYMPAVLTIPGSRGEVANGLRLNLVIDDLLLNCIEVVSASTAKALLLLRRGDAGVETHALQRGIGVVPRLEEAIDVIQRFHALLPTRTGRLLRLADWFTPQQSEPAHPAAEPLPDNPRVSRPLPPSGGL
jgi:hypothetical protein